MSTRKDTERTFVRMAQAAGAAGLDVAGWQLHPGSAANGVSWSIVTPIGASGLVGLPPFGHIGRTAGEADRFLAGMAAAFESVSCAARRAPQTPLPPVAPYTDPSNGEWIGEYATRDAAGDVHRQTQWFATEAQAAHFARTGRIGGTR